jgi:hypothetical protein
MSFLTRRLTRRDFFALLLAAAFVAVVTCLVLTMIRASRLETELEAQAKQLRDMDRIEALQQGGVLAFPRESRTPHGRVEFPRPYDSPPYVAFTKVGGVGGPIPYDLPKDVQESMLKRQVELAERVRRAFTVKAVTLDGFEWEFDSRGFGGGILPDWSVAWEARGMRVVRPR